MGWGGCYALMHSACVAKVCPLCVDLWPPNAIFKLRATRCPFRAGAPPSFSGCVRALLVLRLVRVREVFGVVSG